MWTNRNPRLAAGHSKMPDEILRELALRSDPEIHYWIAHNEGAPLDLLTQLAGSAELRPIVARNPGRRRSFCGSWLKTPIRKCVLEWRSTGVRRLRCCPSSAR